MDENWTQSSSSQSPYSHYQVHNPNHSEYRGDASKHGESLWSKIYVVILCAIVFGIVSGGVFLGVTYYGTRIFLSEIEKEKDAAFNLTQAVPEKEETAVSSEYTALLAENGTVAGVAQNAMPSVVAITSVSIQEIPIFFGYGGYRQYSSTGSGSGIIVGENDDELLIATNNHVVEGSTTLSVCFIGNDVVNAEQETSNLAVGNGDINIKDAVTAKIKGTDPDNDLAVVAVSKADIPEDTMNQIKIAKIGSSDNLVVGEQVVAIGNALGYGQSVTSGWVSALNRSVSTENQKRTELIQTDAAINPGNSGGALLNMKSELIGINSAKYASQTVEGMGYAIPISKALPILEDLMSRKTRDLVAEEDAAYLGVQVADLSAEAIQLYKMPAGAFIVEVAEGGPAEQVGLARGDIILKMDGQKISGRDDLSEQLRYYSANEEIEFVIARAYNGEYSEETVTILMGGRS